MDRDTFYNCINSSTLTPYEIENKIDPDDGIARLCSACTLPIFSTPFQYSDDGGGKLFLHDECATLPKELIGHSHHRWGPLILEENTISNINSSLSWSSSCDICNRLCGISMYRCPDCDFKVDVLCAFPIKILHRSHQHRLMVIKAGSASFICGACKTRHKENLSALFYLCNACEFLIHRDCASLPNAINLKHHQHSLLLTYGLPSRCDNACAICSRVIRSLGVYFCAECNYFAHIQCAISNPQSFESVLIRDAKLAGLLHLPLKENTSVMPHIFKNTASSSVDDRDQIEGKLAPEVLHEHPLIFHDQIDGGDDSQRVCKACVQVISPPFYSCSECPDFFLHSCCANLPSQIKRPTHEHPLSLFPKAPNSSVSGFFSCGGCYDESNRFAYSCNTCDDFTMDVVCALLPPAITHELHGNTHVLYMSAKEVNSSTLRCKCCGNCLLLEGIFYKCSNCHDFAIHAQCAMFPSSIKHKYDEHPLKLTIDNEDGVEKQICETCEETMESSEWYYSCWQCKQSFHRDCIPSVNICSRIKLGGTIHVSCHDCPLTLVLESIVDGYRCGYCSKAFSCPSTFHERPAYECSKCYFRIHDDCATKCLL